MSGKAVRMSPRQQSTSRKHAEGNADYAVEQRPPLAISTGISPAKQQHQSKDQDFFTREQRWGTAFESSSIGITRAALDCHYLAANSVRRSFKTAQVRFF